MPTEEASKITISFHDVDYFSASGWDENPFEGDDSILHSIGAVEPDAETLDVCFGSKAALRQRQLSTQS